MRYVINKENKETAYLQLYKQLKRDIISGIYKKGSKIPSKRILAEETGISTITVEHAYALLSDEGYIDSKERSGYFVVFSKDGGFALASDRSKRKAEEHIITSQNSESFPMSILAKTMRKVISDDMSLPLKKAENTGCIELRLALCEYLYKNRGIDVDADRIVIGSGSEFLYGKIIELLGRDKIYAIESPSYNKIEQIYKISGAKAEKLPLGKDGIISAALLKTKADILHITPYRSFPSGITASASKRHEYINWAEKNNRFIIEDDFESEFSVLTKPEETLFSMSQSDNIIYMNTFTKTISPAFRVGYMVIPEKLEALYKKKLGFYSCTVPTIEQLVLARMISNGDFERHINRVRRNKRKNSK